MKKVVKRMKKNPPPLFKKIRNAGIIAAAAGAAILGAPVALPAVLVKIAGYLIATGAAASAVSQAVNNDDDK
jgi:hypothetical protein